MGGGAAGLTAAYVLQRRYDVTIFEREATLGGHVRTVIVRGDIDSGLALDMGFTIFNDRNYPTMHRLLSRLGIDGIEPSEMSFGYEGGGIRYAVNFGPTGGKRPSPTADAPLGSLLGPALRFCRTAPRDLKSGLLAGKTFGDYCRERDHPAELVEHYLGPLGAASWSLPPETILQFPAETYVAFFDHHGLWGFDAGPRWQYIRGGAARYVSALAKGFAGRVELGARGLRIGRDADGATIHADGRPPARFDHVVLATHADQALSLLLDPSDEERHLLGAWRYQSNRCVLHTDPSVMPADRSIWASWNFRRKTAGGPCTVTYDLNRIQGHTDVQRLYFLSHNDETMRRQDVIAEADFQHPVYTLESIATQAPLRELSGARRTFYCGSYLGYGFHEDAMRSGVAVAEKLGLSL